LQLGTLGDDLAEADAELLPTEAEVGNAREIALNAVLMIASLVERWPDGNARRSRIGIASMAVPLEFGCRWS